MTDSDTVDASEQPTRLEVYVSTAMVLAGLLLVYGAMQLPVVSRGAFSTGPGPGLFPIVSAGILVSLATWHLVAVLRRGAWRHRQNRVAPLVGRVVVIMAVGIALLPLLGFFLDMSLMVAALMLLFGERRSWLVATVAISAALVASLVFGELFSVRLPTIGIPFGPWTL